MRINVKIGRKILRAGIDSDTATAFPSKEALDLLGSVFGAGK